MLNRFFELKDNGIYGIYFQIYLSISALSFYSWKRRNIAKRVQSDNTIATDLQYFKKRSKKGEINI